MAELFVPQVGMQCEDSYLHGAGSKDLMGYSGYIEHVGLDYFILRIYGGEELPQIVYKKYYHAIQPGDFEPPR